MPTELKGLDASKIGELLAGTRTRNQYGPLLMEFMESDEAAINPAETWPLLKDKKPSSLYQGFRNAADKAGISDEILVKLSDDNVFILHKERVRLVMEQNS